MSSSQARPTSWGPELSGHWTWDHTGSRLDTDYYPTLNVRSAGQTRIGIIPYEEFRERLRPQDFGLPQNRDYHEHSSGVSVSSSPVTQLTIGGYYLSGQPISHHPRWNRSLQRTVPARVTQAGSGCEISSDHGSRSTTRTCSAACGLARTTRTSSTTTSCAASGTGKPTVSSLRAIAQYNATPYAESVEQCGEYLHFPADDKEFQYRFP